VNTRETAPGSRGWPAEEFFSRVLPGGMEAWVWRRKGFQNKYAALAARFGAMDARFTSEGKVHEVPDGTAHFLEHMAFETGQGSALALFSRLGVRANAFTSHSATAYYFSATDNFGPALRRLVPLVVASRLTPQGVENEKRVIAQEIRMYEDSPEAKVRENLLTALYHRHPVRRRVAGTLESIAAITPEILLDCHRTFYHPSNLVFMAAGDLQPEAVFEAVARELERAGAFSADPTPNLDRPLPDEPDLPARPSVEVRMPVTRAWFLAGFKDRPRGGGPSLRREIVLNLLVDILFGPTSPVFNDLYRKGLIYTGFSAGYSVGRGFGHVIAGGPTTDPDRVYHLLKKGISGLRQNGITRQELEPKRRKTAGHYAGMFDSLEGMAALFLMARLKGNDLLAYPETLGRITPEEASETLSEVFASERVCLSAVRPG
jgi:predicted Zn-dependent peptidase